MNEWIQTKVIIYNSIKKNCVSQADCPNGEVQTLKYVLIVIHMYVNTVTLHKLSFSYIYIYIKTYIKL